MQAQVRSGTMGTDRLMHKQETGGINELPSYCTRDMASNSREEERGDGGAGTQ